MGMQIAYTGRKAQQGVAWRFVPDLVALAAESDFLIVACPGGPATKNLVDAKVLAALGSKGTIVNIARGSIIDEPALVAALEQGTLGGAGLDVFADEPQVPKALLAMDNVVLLPHVGSATPRDAQGDGRPVQGEPRRVVRGQAASHAHSRARVGETARLPAAAAPRLLRAIAR